MSTLLESALDPRSFDFTQTNGAGVSGNLTSSGAGKVLTFVTLPFGLQVGNRIRVSGGSGTAEAVLITALSGTAGVAGTATVTTANSHTGAWAVSSATAGIQEAVGTVPATNGYASGPTVHIPPGKFPIYATINVDNFASIIGSGSNSTILQKAFTDGDLLYIGDATTTLAGIGGVLRDFMIEPLTGVVDTSGYAIRARYRYNLTIQNVVLYGDGGIGRIKNGIKFDSCLTFSLINTKIFNVVSIGLELTTTGADQTTGRIVAVDVTGPSTTEDLVYFHGNILSTSIDGLQMQGGYRNWYINTTGGAFSESQVNNIVFDSAAHAAFVLDGTGATFKNNFSNIELSTIAGVPSMIGMVFDGTGASVFSDITVTNVVGGVNASNQIGAAIFILSATNFLLSNSQIQGAGGGAGDTAIQIQGTTANVVLTGNVIGYAYDGSTTGSQAYRAVYVPSGTHAGMTITGNRVYGSSIALGIAGAHTNFRESGNSVAGGGSNFSGTGTVLFENLAVPFANLPAASALYQGIAAAVSDCNANTWGATAATGGAFVVKVWCNGTNWTVIGV